MLVLAAVLAAVNLRDISEPALVDVPVPATAIHAGDGIVSGSVLAGLPAYGLRWDGQPPSAILVNPASGVVLAAAAFSDKTFEGNRNAVRFVGGDARFKLDARRWSEGTPLVLRTEAVKPRGWFFFWAGISAALAIALLVAFAFKSARELGRGARLDFAGSLIFIAVACGTFSSIFPGAPIRIEDWSDEAAINSYAAVRDHPAWFTLDKLLSDPANYTWYTPAYIHTIRAFGHLGFHYQTACAFLGAAAALIFLFGLRRLFMAVSGRADFALAATLALGLVFSADVPPYGEVWSIVWVLPRTVFTAFVPWVIVLALHYLRAPGRWWIPCGAAGLLAYLYPLSAPPLVAALLVALVIGSDEPMSARIRGALLAMAAIGVTMLPYAAVYVRHIGAAPDLDPATTRRALEIVRGSFDYVRLGTILRQVPVYRFVTFRILLDAFAALLLIRRRFDSCVRFYLGILAGFALVTFGIPAVDSALATYLDRRQFEYDLARNARFIDFLVAGALAVGVAGWRGTRRQARLAVAAGAVCAAVAFGPGWYDTAFFIASRTRAGWRMVGGHPDRDTAAAQEAIRAVHALRASSERVAGPVALRQYGIPIAWVAKDILTQSYSVSRGLVEANDVFRRAEPLLARPLTDESLRQASSILEAPLFLVPPQQLDRRLAASPCLLFRNDVWAVVCVAPSPLHAADGRVSRSTAREIDGG